MNINITWLTLSRIVQQALAVFANIALARYLGVDRFGEYAYIVAVVMIGNAFTTFGTDMILIRKISLNHDYSAVPAGFVLQLILSVGYIGLVFLAQPFMYIPRSLLIYVFALLPLSAYTISTIVLRGEQRMRDFALLQLAVSVLQVVAIAAVILSASGVDALAWLLLGVQVLGAMFGLVLSRTTQHMNAPQGLMIESVLADFHELRQGFSPPKRAQINTPEQFPLHSKISVFSVAKESFPMAIIGTLRLMYEKLAITILPMLIGINPTGIFSASQRVSDAAKLGHMSALTAMYPQMAREQNIATQRMRFGWLLVAAVGLSLGLSLGAESIVGLLFGAAFVESAEGLRILGWVLPAYFIVTYYSLAFVALAIEKPVLISLVISIIVLVILLWWWSPLWGVKGAAWAVLIAEFVQASLLSLQWRAHVVSQSS